MGLIIRAKHFGGFTGFVWHPFVRHGHDGQDHTFCIAQRNAGAKGQTFREFFRHIQRDGHRPQRAISQSHPINHTVIIGLRVEPLQREKSAIHQKL